jgi:hypothetical protein
MVIKTDSEKPGCVGFLKFAVVCGSLRKFAEVCGCLRLLTCKARIAKMVAVDR